MKKLIFILLCFSLLTFGSSARIIEVAPAGAWGIIGISGGGAVAEAGGDVALAGTLQTVDAAAADGSSAITIDANAEVCVVASAYYYASADWTQDPFVSIGGALGGSNNITEASKIETNEINHVMIGYILQSAIGGTGSQTLYWNWWDGSARACALGGQIFVQCFKNVNTTTPVTAGTTGANSNSTNDLDVTGLTASDTGDMMVGIMGSDGSPTVTGSSQTSLANNLYNSLYGAMAYKLSATLFDVAGGSYSAQAALILNKAP